MREIKFRAWDESTHSMCELVKWKLRDGEVELLYDNHSDLAPTRQTNGPFFRDIERVILMQYTGLKDKNGKEIYEGDIVRMTTSAKGIDKIWVEIFPVVWGEYNDGEYVNNVQCWMVDTTPLSESGSSETYGHGKIEVEGIGNIYENPELLK